MKRIPLAGIENSLPKATTNLNKSQTKKTNVKEINHINDNHATMLTELQQIIELNISNEVDKKRALTIIYELRGDCGSNVTHSTPLLPPQPPMTTGGFAVFEESSTVAVPMSVENTTSYSFLLDEGTDGERPKVVRRSSRRASLAVGGQSSMSSLLTLPLPSTSTSKDIHSSSVGDGDREIVVATSISASVAGSEPASVQGKRGRGGKKGGAASAVAASATLSTLAMVASVSSSEQDQVTTAAASSDPMLSSSSSSSSSSPDRRSQGDGSHGGQSNKAPRTTLEASSPALSRRVRSMTLEDQDQDHPTDGNYYGDDGGEGGREEQHPHPVDDGGVYNFETAMAVTNAESEEAVGVGPDDTAASGLGEEPRQLLGVEEQDSLSSSSTAAVDIDGVVPADVIVSSRMDVEEDVATNNPPSDEKVKETYWPMPSVTSVVPEEVEEQERIADKEEDKAVASKGRGKGRGRGRAKAAAVTEPVSSEDGAAFDAVGYSSISRSSSKGRRASMRFVLAAAAATGTRKGRVSLDVAATSALDEVPETNPPEEDQSQSQSHEDVMVSPTMAASSSSLAALSLSSDCEQKGHVYDHLQHLLSSSPPPPSHTQPTLTDETNPLPLSVSLAPHQLPLDGGCGVGQDHDVSLLSLSFDLGPPEVVQELAPEPGQGMCGFSLSAGRGSSSSSEGLRRYQALLQWCSSDWCNDNDDVQREGPGAHKQEEHLVTTTAAAAEDGEEETLGVGGRRALLVCAAEAAAGLTLGDIRGRMTDAGYPEGADACGTMQEQEQELGCGEPMAVDNGDDGCLETAMNDDDDHRMITDHALSQPPPSTLTHPQETDVEAEVEVEVVVHDDSGLAAACCRHQLEVGSLYSFITLTTLRINVLP